MDENPWYRENKNCTMEGEAGESVEGRRSAPYRIHVNSDLVYSDFLSCGEAALSDTPVDDLPIHVVSSHGSYRVTANCFIEAGEPSEIRVELESASVVLGKDQYVIDVAPLGFIIDAEQCAVDWMRSIMKDRQAWIREFFRELDIPTTSPTHANARVCAGPGCLIPDKKISYGATLDDIASGIETIPASMTTRAMFFDERSSAAIMFPTEREQRAAYETSRVAPPSARSGEYFSHSRYEALGELLREGVPGIYVLHSCSPIEVTPVVRAAYDALAQTIARTRGGLVGICHAYQLDGYWQCPSLERSAMDNPSQPLFERGPTWEEIKAEVFKHIAGKRERQFEEFRKVFAKGSREGSAGQGGQGASRRGATGVPDRAVPMTVTMGADMLRSLDTKRKACAAPPSEPRTFIEEALVEHFVSGDGGGYIFIEVPNDLPVSVAGTSLPRTLPRVSDARVCFKTLRANKSWSDLGLRVVCIRASQLSVIPENTIGLCTGIVMIDIESSIATAPADLANLVNLERLRLASPNLATIPGGIFPSLTKLETLALTCPIETAPAELAQLVNLTYLELDFPNLATIPEGIFPALRKLETLLLRCANEPLPSGTVRLAGLDKLRDLNLNFSTIGHDTMEGLANSSIANVILTLGSITSFPDNFAEHFWTGASNLRLDCPNLERLPEISHDGALVRGSFDFRCPHATVTRWPIFRHLWCFDYMHCKVPDALMRSAGGVECEVVTIRGGAVSTISNVPASAKDINLYDLEELVSLELGWVSNSLRDTGEADDCGAGLPVRTRAQARTMRPPQGEMTGTRAASVGLKSDTAPRDPTRVDFDLGNLPNLRSLRNLQDCPANLSLNVWGLDPATRSNLTTELTTLMEHRQGLGLTTRISGPIRMSATTFRGIRRSTASYRSTRISSTTWPSLSKLRRLHTPS